MCIPRGEATGKQTPERASALETPAVDAARSHDVKQAVHPAGRTEAGGVSLGTVCTWKGRVKGTEGKCPWRYEGECEEYAAGKAGNRGH